MHRYFHDVFGSLDQWFLINTILNKHHIRFAGPCVIGLTESIGHQVPVKNINRRLRIVFLEVKGLFQRICAANATAVIARFLAGIHTLYHDHRIELLGSNAIVGQLLFKFFLRDNRGAGSVPIGCRSGLCPAGRQNGYPMFQGVRCVIGSFQRRFKIPDFATGINHPRPGPHTDLGMLFHLGASVFQQWLYGIAFQRFLQPGQVSTQILRFFHQIDFKSMVGDRQGSRHAGNAATDNQRSLSGRDGGHTFRVRPFELGHTHFQF